MTIDRLIPTSASDRGTLASCVEPEAPKLALEEWTKVDNHCKAKMKDAEPENLQWLGNDRATDPLPVFVAVGRISIA